MDLLRQSLQGRKQRSNTATRAEIRSLLPRPVAGRLALRSGSCSHGEKRTRATCETKRSPRKVTAELTGQSENRTQNDRLERAFSPVHPLSRLKTNGSRVLSSYWRERPRDILRGPITQCLHGGVQSYWYLNDMIGRVKVRAALDSVNLGRISGILGVVLPDLPTVKTGNWS